MPNSNCATLCERLSLASCGLSGVLALCADVQLGMRLRPRALRTAETWSTSTSCPPMCVCRLVRAVAFGDTLALTCPRDLLALRRAASHKLATRQPNDTRAPPVRMSVPLSTLRQWRTGTSTTRPLAVWWIMVEILQLIWAAPLWAITDWRLRIKTRHALRTKCGRSS
jgi:hypothetical protein